MLPPSLCWITVLDYQNIRILEVVYATNQKFLRRLPCPGPAKRPLLLHRKSDTLRAASTGRAPAEPAPPAPYSKERRRPAPGADAARKCKLVGDLPLGLSYARGLPGATGPGRP